MDSSEFSTAQRIVVISGLGGIGKTQLILYFTQLYERKFTSIIWLDASSESSLRQSLVRVAWRIAELSGLDRRNLDKTEGEWIMQARLWLSNPSSVGWLLLMDNYDDPSDVGGFVSESGYDIQQYFPQRLQGSILITSRANIEVLGAVIRPSKLLDINERVQILYQRSGRERSSSSGSAS